MAWNGDDFSGSCCAQAAHVAREKSGESAHASRPLAPVSQAGQREAASTRQARVPTTPFWLGSQAQTIHHKKSPVREMGQSAGVHGEDHPPKRGSLHSPALQAAGQAHQTAGRTSGPPAAGPAVRGLVSAVVEGQTRSSRTKGRNSQASRDCQLWTAAGQPAAHPADPALARAKQPHGRRISTGRLMPPAPAEGRSLAPLRDGLHTAAVAPSSPAPAATAAMRCLATVSASVVPAQETRHHSPPPGH